MPSTKGKVKARFEVGQLGPERLSRLNGLVGVYLGEACQLSLYHEVSKFTYILLCILLRRVGVDLHSIRQWSLNTGFILNIRHCRNGRLLLLIRSFFKIFCPHIPE